MATSKGFGYSDEELKLARKAGFKKAVPKIGKLTTKKDGKNVQKSDSSKLKVYESHEKKMKEFASEVKKHAGLHKQVQGKLAKFKK